MQYKVEILPNALEDLKCIQDYYCLNFSKESALIVTESILESIDRLEYCPDIGSKLKFDEYIREMDYRMVLSKEYASIYRVIGNIVYVYHIVNTKTEYKNLFKAFN